MQLDIADIDRWACEEIDGIPDGERRARKAVLRSLTRQCEAEQRLPQPAALEPGSPQRQMAEGRQRRIRNLASALGYKPAGEEVAGELAKHVAIDALPVAGIVKAGIEISGDGGNDSWKPAAPDEKERRRSAKVLRDGGLGFGFSLGDSP